MSTGSARIDFERSAQTVELEAWARRAEAANGFGDGIPRESLTWSVGTWPVYSTLGPLDEECE